MKSIQLISKHNNLHTKFEDIVEEDLISWWKNDEKDSQDPVLLYHYPEGDVDTISSKNPNLDHLASALYDCRECGLIPSDTTLAILPDGSTVIIGE
jgi:hypothetical protein